MSESASPPPLQYFTNGVNDALARITPQAAFNAASGLKQNGAAYALIGTGITLMSVRPHKVENKRIERTCMGEGTGTFFHWLQADRENVHYDRDALASGLFGPVSEGKLSDPAFDLARKDLDLCNVFLALSRGMYDLQDLPAAIKHNGYAGRQGYQAFVALAAHMPEPPSMQPYKAEIVLALAKTGAPDLPLFNLGKVEIVQSNDHSDRPSLRAESHAGRVAYTPA